jgi:hypothetical protein
MAQFNLIGDYGNAGQSAPLRRVCTFTMDLHDLPEPALALQRTSATPR